MKKSFGIEEGDYRVLKDPLSILCRSFFLIRSACPGCGLQGGCRMTRAAEGWCVLSSCPKQESENSQGPQPRKTPQNHLHLQSKLPGTPSIQSGVLWSPLLQQPTLLSHQKLQKSPLNTHPPT